MAEKQMKTCSTSLIREMQIKTTIRDIPVGTVDGKTPANAEDTSSIPAIEEFHMPWST